MLEERRIARAIEKRMENAVIDDAEMEDAGVKTQKP